MGLISPIGEIGKIGKMSVDKIAAMAFESKGGKDYIVEVYKRDTPGVMYNLTPAADPFSTTENTSEDPMEPVRGSTGYLRFMYEGGANGDGEPWWVDLMPADATEVAVYLKDAEGVIYWQGYAAPSQYSHDYSEEVQTIELPIVSALEVLNAIEMDAANVMQAATWRDLLVEAIDKSGLSVSGLWVPYEWGTEKLSSEYAVERVADINFAAPLVCKVSRFAWFDTTDAKNDGDPNYREYEGASYGTMLADWCRFFGWTIKERGSEWWLVSRRARKYCKLTAAQLENLTDEQLMGRDPRGAVDVQTVELTDALLDGINHSLDVAPAVRTVEVDADSQEIDKDVLNINHNKLDFAGSVAHEQSYSTPSSSVFTTHFVQMKAIAYKPVGYPSLQAWKKRKTGYWTGVWSEMGDEDWTDILGIVNQSRAFVGSECDSYIGIGKVDFWNETDEADKKNYNYKEGVLWAAWGITEKETYTQPVIAIKGDKSGAWRNGYFVIDAGLFASRSVDNMAAIRFTLSVGPDSNGRTYYWNGTAWTTDATMTVRIDDEDVVVPVSFTIPLEYGSVVAGKPINGETVDMKTLSMTCNGAEGYIIHIDRELEGRLQLKMYSQRTGAADDLAGVVLVEKMEVEYYAEEDERLLKESVNKYYAVTGATGTETKKIGLSLATENNNNPGHGLIKYDGAIADGTTFMTPPTAGREAEVARPEEVLLATARAAYGVRRRKMQMVMTLENRERPIDYMTRAEWNDPFVPVAEAIDWAEDRRTLTLMG